MFVLQRLDMRKYVSICEKQKQRKKTTNMKSVIISFMKSQQQQSQEAIGDPGDDSIVEIKISKSAVQR